MSINICLPVLIDALKHFSPAGLSTKLPRISGRQGLQGLMTCPSIVQAWDWRTAWASHLGD